METKNENQKSAGKKIKFAVIAAALVIAGLVAGYAIGIFVYLKIIGPYVSEMKYKAFLEDYLKPYKEDFIGGNTPEETIDLFIEALKKGDGYAANKYFIVSEQEKWNRSFEKSTKENIEDWVIELENAKKIWQKEQLSDIKIIFKYNIGNGDDERTNFIYVSKNMNNKWKIEGF